MGPLVDHWDGLASDILGSLRPPKHPIVLGRFGLRALRSAYGLAKGTFEGEQARGLFGGLGGHSMMPLERKLTASFGLVLGATGHAFGWPVVRGGSGALTRALASLLQSIGGEIVTSNPVESIDDLPSSKATLLDLTPRQVVAIAGQRLSDRYRRKLEGYRYGIGVFKIDWALDGPIPWKAGECARAGTVHVGGTLDEVAEAERAPWRDEHPERPFALVGQQSLFDSSRAPEGKHTAWAYCHVPNGSTFDMTDRIEAQIERFAPGFRDRVLAKASKSPAALEEYNPNYVGGDINGGVQDFRQLYTRPMLRWVPYSTSDKSIYICSSSTPPGGGVHGMCGYHAARAALRGVLR